MPILSVPLGIKLYNKSNIKNSPDGTKNSPEEFREKLPSGWRPPKTSQKKSRPNSTRPKKNKLSLTISQGEIRNSHKQYLTILLQSIVRGFLARQNYKRMVKDKNIIFPLKKKNQRLQRLKVLAELE